MEIMKLNTQVRHKEEEKNGRVFITSIFILSLVALLVCFFYLEFWYAIRDGLQNGFHIKNTSYSFLLWISHISYLSCIWIVLWSCKETIYVWTMNENYKPSYSFKLFAQVWILTTMAEGAIGMASIMAPRVDSLAKVFDSDNWSNEYWFGINGFFYSLLDFFQYLSIHVVLPIMIIFYMYLFDKNAKVDKMDFKKFVISNNLFMIIWYILTGLLTYFGMESPYAYVNWTNDPEWSLTIQLITVISVFIVINIVSIVIIIKRIMWTNFMENTTFI